MMILANIPRRNPGDVVESKGYRAVGTTSNGL